MVRAEFDAVEGLKALEDLARVTAFPAEPEEICEQGLGRPAVWPAEARVFARGAGGVSSASLLASRKLAASRQQGELLARRNIELETLRELAGRLHEPANESEVLQTALDLVLEKLGLGSGWIFWGETSRGVLELAARRGVADD